jgi:hypothetical protein
MKKYSVELKWAVLFTLMMFLWMVLQKVTGLYSHNIESHAVVTNFVSIPAIAIYVLALLDKRKKDYGGYMTYKQGFISGLIITLFVTLLAPLVQYITTTFIAPEYFPNMINHAVANGKMTQPEAESYFNLKSYLVQVVLFTPVMGVVTTAIVAIFTRRNRRAAVGQKENVGQAAMVG